MTYRYLATSPAGFVQQLAVSYIAHGHFFYVAGSIPPGKSREAVDQKLISLYGIDQSRWQRCRRKLAGRASVHYIRYDSFFILIASHGKHEFFELEENVVRDVRREPIAFAGYSISHRQGVDGKGHPSVRIHPNEYRWLKQYMTEVAKRAPTEAVLDEFRMLRFEPYAPVVRQLFGILRAVNKVRKVAGLEQVPMEAVRTRRRVLKPFEPVKYGKAA